MMKTEIPARDLIKLCAYLDGELSPSQESLLAARLAQEPELRMALDDLRKTRSVLRAAPRLRSPRNFTLTPAMVGQPIKAQARFVPAYRFVSAIASLLLVLVVAGDLLGAGFSRMAAEQAMPVMVEDQQPSVALEAEVMEAPAAAATLEDEAGEMETFALEVEPTLVVEQEIGISEEERAEKSELPAEPDAEGLAMTEPEVTPTLEVPPAEEVLLMQEAPAPEEPAENAKEYDSEVLEEAAQEPPGEADLAAKLEASSEQALDEVAPMDDELAGDMARAMRERAPAEPASAPDLGKGPVWTPLRIAELGLALVALSFGVLAWVYRRRG